VLNRASYANGHASEIFKGNRKSCGRRGASI
jgi:hypothetical protein